MNHGVEVRATLRTMPAMPGPARSSVAQQGPSAGASQGDEVQGF